MRFHALSCLLPQFYHASREYRAKREGKAKIVYNGSEPGSYSVGHRVAVRRDALPPRLSWFLSQREWLGEEPLSSSTALSLVDLITNRRLWELDRILADTDGIVDSKEKTVLLLRLKPLLRQIEKEARAEKNKIPYMSMNAPNDNRLDRVVTERSKIEFKSFANFVQAIYDSLSAVRQHQGIQEDPQHIRDSFNKVMVPLIETEKEHFRARFPDNIRLHCEVARLDFPELSVEDRIKLFCRAADKLKERLWENIELEAAELELTAERQGVKQARGSPQSNRHDPLKALIGTTKRDHPGISHRDLCRRLDVNKVALPHGSTWQKKSGKRGWPENYDCAAVHPLMDTYLSKIPPASPKRKNTK